MMVEAVVIGVGPKSFTLFMPALGIEHRSCVDDIDGIQHVDHDAVNECLTIGRAPVDGCWSSITLRMLCKLNVKVSCRPKPPLGVAVEIVGVAADSPL
jgi:hypothetical protein